MSFWDLNHASTHPALVDGTNGRFWSYGDLKKAVALFCARLGKIHQKQLGFILCSNTPECVAAYIGSLQSNTAVALISDGLPAGLLSGLFTIYCPGWVFAVNSVRMPPDYKVIGSIGGYCLWGSQHAQERDIGENLAVLLSTSGSTGSPKLVRLSRMNLQANAESIHEYLGLNEQEKPITSLPMAYSYGLSVINSHLNAGAPILLTNDSVLQRSFWNLATAERATSFAGVPYTYQLLLRAGLMQRAATIRTWTQAGGGLAANYLRQVHNIALAMGSRLFVMYGQTEATARISYLPPDELASNMGSIGIPIPGGKLRVEVGSGELVYTGPNVMLGYAENIDDLSKGDELNGELYTGDLASQDENGYFRILGRMKRFLKLAGLRLSLDDIEALLGNRFDSPLACFGTDELLQIAVEDRSVGDPALRFCCDLFKLHRSVVRVCHVERLPLTSNGKTDYGALATVAASMIARAGQ